LRASFLLLLSRTKRPRRHLDLEWDAKVISSREQ
jgi:hypothetical protein